MTDVDAPALRILVFVGHGTGGSSAKRIRAIGEARGARVDLSGAEAIRALSPLEHDVVVFPGGSAVQQFNSIGAGVQTFSFSRFSHFFFLGQAPTGGTQCTGSSPAARACSDCARAPC